MADEDEEPAVTLGESHEVEGAPLSRVTARLMWGIEKGAIEHREGDTVVRTPEGPRELADILAEVDSTYFATKQEFQNAVRDVVGTGPVPTVGGGPPETNGDPSTTDEEEDADEDADEDTDEAGTDEDADENEE